MNSLTKISKNNNQVSSQLDDKTVILDIEGNRYFSLVEVGADIFKLIDETPQTIESIAAKILSEYDVDKEVLLKDMHELLGDMEKTGLVKVV